MGKGPARRGEARRSAAAYPSARWAERPTDQRVNRPSLMATARKGTWRCRPTPISSQPSSQPSPQDVTRFGQAGRQAGRQADSLTDSLAAGSVDDRIAPFKRDWIFAALLPCRHRHHRTAPQRRGGDGDDDSYRRLSSSSSGSGRRRRVGRLEEIASRFNLLLASSSVLLRKPPGTPLRSSSTESPVSQRAPGKATRNQKVPHSSHLAFENEFSESNSD